MAEIAIGMTSPEDPAPRIHLRNDQISKYCDLDFDSVDVGDTMEKTFKVKVTEKGSRKEEEYDYEKGESTGKMKENRSIELEIVGRDMDKEKDYGKAKMQRSGKGLS